MSRSRMNANQDVIAPAAVESNTMALECCILIATMVVGGYGGLGRRTADSSNRNGASSDWSSG